MSRLQHVGSFLLLLTMILSVTVSARAEYRSALLISNTEYKAESDQVEPRDLTKLSTDLAKYGFDCQVQENLLNEKAIRAEIEKFISNTPTRSTALIYFHGKLAEGGSWLGVDSRSSYKLENLLEVLNTRGASSQTLLLVDAEGKKAYPEKLHAGFLVAYVTPDQFQSKLTGKGDLLAAITAAGESRSALPEGATIAGSGSQAISPIDKFVTGRKAGDEWVNSLGLVFCWCPPGKFTTGSPESVPGRYPDEEQQEVTIDQGFWLSKYELCLSQRVAKRGPGRTIASHRLHPMTMINHDDAKAMTKNFTVSERAAGRLPQGWEYSLPTAEQWEHAARAGTSSRYYFGENMSLLTQHANFADKSYYDSGDIYSNSAHRTLDDGVVRLAHVGSYQPNPWGFYDIYGNVAEWCIDGAVRGGSWVSVPENCRSGYRDRYSSRNEQNFIGYRLVIQPVSASPKKK